MSVISAKQKMQMWEDASRFYPNVNKVIIKTTDHHFGYAIIIVGIIFIAVAALALINNLYWKKPVTPQEAILPKVFGGVGLGVTGLGFLVTLLFYMRGKEARQMIYGEDSQKKLQELKMQ